MHSSELRSFRSALAAVVCYLLFLATAHADSSMKAGDRAPDWMLSDKQGRNVAFYQDSDNRPAVLLFWASWCPTCIELMAELSELRSELSEQRIRFYALNIWEDADPAALMRERDLDFTLLLNADTVAKRYKVRGTPGLFVVNADKSLRFVRKSNSSGDDIRRAIRAAVQAD